LLYLQRFILLYCCLCRATRNGIHQHGMLRAAEVSQQLCRKLKRMGLNTNSSCEGDIDTVRSPSYMRSWYK
jgi:hypothetical protein